MMQKLRQLFKKEKKEDTENRSDFTTEEIDKVFKWAKQKDPLATKHNLGKGAILISMPSYSLDKASKELQKSDAPDLVTKADALTFSSPVDSTQNSRSDLASPIPPALEAESNDQIKNRNAI